MGDALAVRGASSSTPAAQSTNHSCRHNNMQPQRGGTTLLLFRRRVDLCGAGRGSASLAADATGSLRLSLVSVFTSSTTTASVAATHSLLAARDGGEQEEGAEHEAPLFPCSLAAYGTGHCVKMGATGRSMATVSHGDATCSVHLDGQEPEGERERGSFLAALAMDTFIPTQQGGQPLHLLICSVFSCVHEHEHEH